MAAKHTCYFSKVDRNSQIVIEQLYNSPFSREFRYFCVDPLPSTGKRPPLPPYVRAVPMLIIEGETTPRVDAEIQNWISERKLRESGSSGVDGDWGLSGISGGGGDSTSPMGEIWSSTEKAPTMTNRTEGSMVSFTADDSQFGKMMASDAPIGGGAGQAGQAQSQGQRGGRAPSAKLQESEARMAQMMKMRSETDGPRPPAPPAWITQGGQGQQQGSQQYSQQQMMMAQQQQQLMQQRQRQMMMQRR